MPGYRVLDLQGNADVDTRIIRIRSDQGEIIVPTTEAEV